MKINDGLEVWFGAIQFGHSVVDLVMGKMPKAKVDATAGSE